MVLNLPDWLLSGVAQAAVIALWLACGRWACRRGRAGVWLASAVLLIPVIWALMPVDRPDEPWCGLTRYVEVSGSSTGGRP